ncbi:hypothetical protein SAMN02799641_02867 [Rhodococcus erythropolis]|nr:hypothetical protein SAMN02799641_02867 [Rhodococcus erythropolis]
MRCGWSGRCGPSMGRQRGLPRSWVTGSSPSGRGFTQADIDDGLTVGVSTAEADRIKQLEQEIRELPRANEILKRAASFFGAELDR